MHICKICKSQTKKVKDTKKSIIYHRCLSCGFISIDKLNIVDKIEEKKHYEKHENSFGNNGYVTMFQNFIDIAILPFSKKIKTALDFGCGFAPVLASLLENEKMIVDRYDYYFDNNEEYKNKKYDLITSTEVFEHLQNPIEILKILVNSTNKDGYIVLMTKFPPFCDEEFLKWWYRRDITHISFFTPKSFEILAVLTGLKFIKTINDNIVVFKK